MTVSLTLDQQQRLKFWLPPLLCGALAWLVLVVIGQTPLVRASGLALVIVGMAASLRRMGSILAFIGGLTLAFSPSFWSQSGGAENTPATIIIAIALAGGAILLTMLVSKRPALGFGVGVLVFAVLFSSQIGTPRSLRLTAFVVSWLLYLVTDMLLVTNPHPAENAPPILQNQQGGVTVYHRLGVLLLFGVGVLNDSLLLFLAPALALAFWLARVRLAWWYWGAFVLLCGVGVLGFTRDYLDAQAHYLVLEEWRNADRWLLMVSFVVGQYSFVGVVLSVLGLARLSRWYPPLGAVTLVAYGCYTFFGLIYDAPQREILLLPLLVIQGVWMTYALFTVGEWVHNAFVGLRPYARWGVRLFYAILPALLLWAQLNR